MSDVASLFQALERISKRKRKSAMKDAFQSLLNHPSFWIHFEPRRGEGNCSDASYKLVDSLGVSVND